MSAVQFTAGQQDAFDIEKRHLDACVVAGPGSGKTTVLVEYFRRLVEAGVNPLRILAITFTEKAAGNMRKKLAETFHEDRTIRAGLERAWVSTVHGFCMRLLRENAVFAGVDPEFRIADERESWRMQQESIAAAIEEEFTAHEAAMKSLIRGLGSPTVEQAILGAYDAMRGAGIRVEELVAFPIPPAVGREDIAATLRALRADPLDLWNPAQKIEIRDAMEAAERVVSSSGAEAALRAIAAFACNLSKCKRGTPARELAGRLKEHIEAFQYAMITELYAPERRLLLDIAARFDREYRGRKSQAGALDFSDLEEHAVRLLEEHPETRARVQAQFDHILMDEFQDTNGQQARLLQLVRAPDRFYAVGDINQSIFGFRHAEPEGFEEYRDTVEQTGRHLAELVHNFRSRADILRAVETVVEGKEGIVKRSLVAGRAFESPRDVCVDAIYVRESEAEEARWVARRALDFLAEGFALKDIAVLVRNTEVLGDFTAALDEAGIPYLVNRGKGFYEAREVNDLTQLLRVIANPRDEIAMATVLRSPLAAVSDESLLRLKASGENLGAALGRLGREAAAEFGAVECGKLVRFRDRLHEWRARRAYVTFDRLLLAAIDDCGYRAESGARGEANIDKFLAQARDAAARMTLDEFVEEIAILRATNPREPDAPPEDSANAVQIMTVHSAKGLEFPVVFLAAMHKGIDTDVPVVAFSRRYGLGARWRNPASGTEKDDLFQHAIREERKAQEAAESHRLLYVAMTRAEQHLVLSFSGKRLINWAKEVVDTLHLDLEVQRDEVIACRAPGGESWSLRVLVADRGPSLARYEGAVEAEKLPELVAPPAVSEQQDANATVTALGTFAACPRKYYLGGYLGFEGRARCVTPGDETSLPANELGTQVHALLAGCDLPQADAEAVRLAEVFRRSPLGRRAAGAGRAEREFDFLTAIEGLVVTGQVDLWFEDAGELVIVDYKTDAVSAAEAHLRAQDYTLQLRLYAMAVEHAAGRAPDRAFLHFLRPNTVVEIDLAPSLLDAPEPIARDFQEAQSTLWFPLNEGEHCRRCEFYHDLCPAR